MKKRKYTRKLARNINQRQALFRGLLVALFTHDNLHTTKAKAKAVQRLADKIITKAKQNTVHARRQVHKIIQDKNLVHKIFTDIAKKYAKCSGGYTKITYLYHRRGDNALIVNLSLLDVTPHTTSSKSSQAPSSSSQKIVSQSKSQPKSKTPSTSKPKSQPKPSSQSHKKTKSQSQKQVQSKPKQSSSSTQKEVK